MRLREIFFTPSCNLSEKQSQFQHTHDSHQRHPNKPETGRMTQSCMSLNQKERVQSGSQPAGTELPEALLTVSVSLVLSTNRCAISWAMWPDPKNISNPKVESCHKIKVINQHNYICTFFHFESLMWGWKHQKSTSRKYTGKTKANHCITSCLSLNHWLYTKTYRVFVTTPTGLWIPALKPRDWCCG